MYQKPRNYTWLISKGSQDGNISITQQSLNLWEKNGINAVDVYINQPSINQYFT